MPHRESDQQYFSRRYEEENVAAEAAINRKARIAHLELAARYAQLAAAIGEVEVRLGAMRRAALPRTIDSKDVRSSSALVARK